MEERDLIPEIDPTLGLTDEQVQSRTPAGKPVYSGKSEKEIVLTHCFTFFNLIFVVLAVMLIIGGSSPLNMGFLVVAVINTVIGIIQEIRAKRAVERLTLVAERPVAVIRNGTRQEISPEAIVKDDIAEFASGDTLPADGILRSGEMWVDESLLTGEADAVTKTPGDEVKSGSAILSGRGRVQFTAVGGDSFAARLSREAQKNPGAKKSEMMRSLDRLILFVGIALVPVGIILFYQEFCVLKLGLESSVEGTVAALVGMLILTWIIQYTRLGRICRATQQDRRMAAILGINTDRVISLVFVIGAAMAGLAGVLVTMNYGTFDFYIGFIIGIKAFTAAVLGGIGSLPGAMLGGLLLGVAEAQFAGLVNSDYKDVFSFALLVAIARRGCWDVRWWPRSKEALWVKLRASLRGLSKTR